MTPEKDLVLYHGTSSIWIPSIRVNGLVPSIRLSAWDEIYLTDSLDDAQYWAGRRAERDNSDPVILIVRVPKTWVEPDWISLALDHGLGIDARGGWSGDDTWLELVETYGGEAEASLAWTGRVSVRRIIPSARIDVYV